MLIVFPVFKRLDALQHFKQYFDKLEYREFVVYISLEGGADDIIKDYVLNIKFEFLHWEVRVFGQRQGLKNHILQCGDLVEDYKDVLIIEDDLLLLPGWNNWLRVAIIKLKNNPKLDSASLYRYSIDEGTSVPLDLSVVESYNSQYASSWGQVWTFDKWQRFRIWMKKNELSEYNQLPPFINNWSVNSWKKHYIVYLMENDLYCCYPENTYVCHSRNMLGTNLTVHSYFRTHYGLNCVFNTHLDSDIYFDVNWSRTISVFDASKNYSVRYNNGLPFRVHNGYRYFLVAGYCCKSIAQWDILLYPLHSNTNRIPDNSSKWGLHLIDSGHHVCFSKAYLFYVYYLDRINSKDSIVFIGLVFVKVLRRLLFR